MEEHQEPQQALFQSEDSLIKNIFDKQVKTRVDSLLEQSESQTELLQNLNTLISQLQTKAQQLSYHSKSSSQNQNETQITKPQQQNKPPKGSVTPRDPPRKKSPDTSSKVKDVKEQDRQDLIKEKKLEQQRKDEELKKKKEEDKARKEEAKKKKDEEQRLKQEKQKEERKKQEEEKKAKLVQQEQQKKQQQEQQKKEQEQKKKELEEKKAHQKKEVEDKKQKKQKETDKKEETKQEIKQEVKQETKQEIKTETKQESKQEVKQEIQQEVNQQTQQSEQTSKTTEQSKQPPQEISTVPAENLEVKKEKLEQIKRQLIELEAPEVLNETSFSIGVGAKNAIELISSCTAQDLYDQSSPDEKTEICFKLYFVLLNIEIQTPFWPQVQQYLKENETLLGQVVLQSTETFNFSDENISKIKQILGDKSVNQVLDPSLCSVAITGFLMFPLKEAAEFAGLVPTKCPIWREHKNLKNEIKKLESELA